MSTLQNRLTKEHDKALLKACRAATKSGNRMLESLQSEEKLSLLSLIVACSTLAME